MVRDKEILNIFSKRLRKLIEDEKISITAFSKSLEIPPRTLESWLACVRSPSIYYVVKLAKYFDVPTDYLLGVIDGEY